MTETLLRRPPPILTHSLVLNPFNEDNPFSSGGWCSSAPDPSGENAVQCAVKSLHNTQLLLCANTIRTYTEAEIAIPESGPEMWQEYFEGEYFYTVDNTVRMAFSPLEVKVFMEVVQK